MKGLVMKVGTMVLDQYQNLTKEKNLSPLLATMIIAGVGVVGGTFIILLFGLLLVSKQKTD
jgi:ABC-type phosphate/phosphonate transport system permease subunit